MTKQGSIERRPGVNAEWLHALRHYLILIILCNLVWETLHLPLYTIWTEGTRYEIVFAVVHCTAGDLLIALSCLIAGLVFFGNLSWPNTHFWRVGIAAIILGVSYTIFSEWLNLVVRKSWAYSDLMPVVPLLGAGLSPLLQWIVIPFLGFLSVERSIGANRNFRIRFPF